MKRLVLLLALASCGAFAQPAGGPPPNGEHRGPPPEAIKACDGKKATDACSFTSPRGKAEGTCFTPESSKPLACRPKNAPTPPKQ